MTYLVLDLEWNGTYARKCKGYFNEIIEIGAVKLSSDLAIVDTFDVLIRPVVSRKLTSIVTGLTGFTDDQLAGGVTFTAALSRLRRFIGKDDTVVMTWSNTDLMVLMENCRYFLKEQAIPFLTAYIDLQAYAQRRRDLGTSQQIALDRFAELLGIKDEATEWHHAIDDSLITAKIFQQVYEPHSFAETVMPVDERFYERLLFRPSYIHDIDDPLIRRGDLRFSCDTCGHNLKRMGEWKLRHHSFAAAFSCPHCHTDFIGRVSARRKFDGVEIKKRLLRKNEPSSETEGDQHGTY